MPILPIQHLEMTPQMETYSLVEPPSLIKAGGRTTNDVGEGTDADEQCSNQTVKRVMVVNN